MTQPKIDGVGHGIPRMLFASDGSNWYAVQVDSDGHVKVDVISAALPTDAATQTTLASVLTALQTIDDFALGTNKLFGYYDTLTTEKSTTTLPAGDSFLHGDTVPAGELWVVEVCVMRYVGTAPTALLIYKNDGITYYAVEHQATIVSGRHYPINRTLFLKAGERLSCQVIGATLNDDLYFRYLGYKMKIA